MVRNSYLKLSYALFRTICKCDINISSGKFQLTKHFSSKKKWKNALNKASVGEIQLNLATMLAEGTRQKTIEEKTKEGIIRTAELLAEHNLSINLMDHMIYFINAVCPDLSVYKKIKIKRIKITSFEKCNRNISSRKFNKFDEQINLA